MNETSIKRWRFAIGLVLYHPEERLFNRINLMLELGFCVYVFDNSPFANPRAASLSRTLNISYLTSGKNVGISRALSTICATAYAQGFTRLLFLDQDTNVSQKTFEFIECTTACIPSDTQEQYAALVYNGQLDPSTKVRDVRFAISSGSLFNLSIMRQIDWHNDAYFVDCVDYEFCLRARRSGFKIGILHNTPDFDHLTEQPDKSLQLFGKQLLIRRYSSTRVRDALTAYLRLIIPGIFKNSPADTCALLKSMLIYTLGQFMARVTMRKKMK